MDGRSDKPGKARHGGGAGRQAGAAGGSPSKQRPCVLQPMGVLRVV